MFPTTHPRKERLFHPEIPQWFRLRNPLKPIIGSLGPMVFQSSRGHGASCSGSLMYPSLYDPIMGFRGLRSRNHYEITDENRGVN